MITITKLKGLGNLNCRVITPNATYLINTKSDLKISETKNNCYIEWVCNNKGQIIGLVEVYSPKILINGRFEEKVINKIGDYSNLIF